MSSYVLMIFYDTEGVKYLVIEDDDRTSLIDTFNNTVTEIDDYCDFINEIDFTQEVKVLDSSKKYFEEWVLENTEYINKEVVYNLGKILH